METQDFCGWRECYTSELSPRISRAGKWFVHSGIQQAEGGVARYYRSDFEQPTPVSTEITGYAAGAFVYMHSLTREPVYLERATAAARFLATTAWDPATRMVPFELDPPALTYFFDSGIIVRGLLQTWRATGEDQFLETAAALGKAMAADFESPATSDYHPVLRLPGKEPLERDPASWSRSAGCYQLKAAMAWWDLAEATADDHFRGFYERVLEYSLRTAATFLPGHPEKTRVMDRLHAYLYFLEGLLPRTNDRRCASALCAGIRQVAELLRAIAPEFERADVLAQLLRIRICADWTGVAPLDLTAAREEADRLASYQLSGRDARTDGGFAFGRRGGVLAPHVSPVPAAFALQALALWESATGNRSLQPHVHLLI